MAEKTGEMKTYIVFSLLVVTIKLVLPLLMSVFCMSCAVKVRIVVDPKAVGKL